MSWAFGRGRHPRTGLPRDIGYGVSAFCDEPKCWEDIDRGLAYRCGGQDSMGPGEDGCGGFFCAPHLWFHVCEGEDRVDGQFCPSCLAKIERRHLRQCADCREAQESVVA